MINVLIKIFMTIATGFICFMLVAAIEMVREMLNGGFQSPPLWLFFGLGFFGFAILVVGATLMVNMAVSLWRG